jgi:ABC-type nitrate/sulfonate/bicarbonate transport system substrate-binding protein
MSSSVAPDPRPSTSEGTTPFWLAWHAASVLVVLAAPALYRWGRGNMLPDWMSQVIAMGAAYLCLATLIALLRPPRTIASVLGLALAGVGVFATAYVLLVAAAAVPVSRGFVAIAAGLGTSLALLPLVLGPRRALGFVLHGAILASLVVIWTSYESGRARVQVVLGIRSLSKLPFIIALDQGLYEKHGLDVEMWLSPPEFPGGISMPANGRARPLRPHILVDGQAPIIFRMVNDVRWDDRIALAGGDCMVRTQIIGSKALTRLEDLKGKRLGVNHQVATTGFVARLLAQRMGWDPVRDLSILDNGRDAEALRQGLVDAVVANERQFATLAEEGYPVLANTQDWNEPIAGNSVLVQPEWLKADGHRDIAMRFLKASAEGIALFHEQPELALAVLAKWYGVPTRKMAETIYGRGDSMPRKPYPCVDGIRKTMELFDSNEMRRYQPEDFYDDSLLRELDAGGFLDGLYK